jgi:LmbE family N-acetylglucosaminyl deacetylase
MLVVLAHPDDETFGCGGTLAKYAHEGARVTLVCATRGEVGEISDPSLAAQDNLGEVREQELRNAANALGIQDVVLLGYRDSGMVGTADNEHPNAFAGASFDEVVSKVVRIVREFRPQVILTFDENGGYGHPDHIMAHRAATEAYSAAADPLRYPEQLVEGLNAHATERLYNIGFTRSMVEEFRAAIRESSGEDPEGFDAEKFGIPDDQVTTVLDVSAYGDNKLRAALSHKTQIRAGDDPFGWLPDRLKQRFLSTEHLVRKSPPWQAGTPPETSLF